MSCRGPEKRRIRWIVCTAADEYRLRHGSQLDATQRARCKAWRNIGGDVSGNACVARQHGVVSAEAVERVPAGANLRSRGAVALEIDQRRGRIEIIAGNGGVDGEPECFGAVAGVRDREPQRRAGSTRCVTCTGPAAASMTTVSSTSSTTTVTVLLLMPGWVTPRMSYVACAVLSMRRPASVPIAAADVDSNSAATATGARNGRGLRAVTRRSSM